VFKNFKTGFVIILNLGSFNLIRFDPIHYTYVGDTQNAFYFTIAHSLYVKLKSFNDIIIRDSFAQFLDGEIVVAFFTTVALTIFNYTTFNIACAGTLGTVFYFFNGGVRFL